MGSAGGCGGLSRGCAAAEEMPAGRAWAAVQLIPFSEQENSSVPLLFFFSFACVCFIIVIIVVVVIYFLIEKKKMGTPLGTPTLQRCPATPLCPTEAKFSERWKKAFIPSC